MSKNARVIVLALVGIAVVVGGIVLLSGDDDPKQPTEVTAENRDLGGPVPSPVDDSSPSDSGDKSKSGSGGKSKSGGGSTASAGASAGGGTAAPPKQVTVDPGGGANASKGKRSKLSAKTFTIIKVLRGERVRLRARSAVPDVMHIYGYEYKVTLPANKTVAYSFKAKRDGIFMISFEKQGLNVGELRVSP